MSVAHTRRLSGWELLAAALTFLLPVVFLPSLAAPFWAPKAALVLLLAGLAIPLLLAPLDARLQLARLAALAFVAVAGISMVLAPQPLMALVGEWNWGTGFLFVLGLMGAWALGLRVGPDARVWIERALLAAVAANVLAVYVQAGFDLDHVSLGRIDGRPVGLLGNPVHVGTLLVCGLVLALPRTRRHPLMWAIPLILLGGAVEIVGGRFAALGAILVLAVALPMIGWRTVGWTAATLLTGVLLASSPLLLFDAASTSGEVVTLTSRAGATEGQPGGGSLAPRLATWWSARHAVVDRPILGYGPGRFGAATGQYRPRELTADGGRFFKDAHNIVIEHLTTMGLVGLSAFALFVGLAVRRASRCTLTAAAAVIGAGLLVQPQTVGLTPLLFLALSAATTTARPPPLPVGLRLGAVGTTALAALAGTSLILGAFKLNQADLDFELADAQASNRYLPAFPQSALQLATIQQFRAIGGAPGAHDSADEWLAEAIRRDPTVSPAWLRWGEYAESRRNMALAERCYRKALELDPISAAAAAGLARLTD